MSSKRDNKFILIVRPDWYLYRMNKMVSIIKGIAKIRGGDCILINDDDAQQLEVNEGDQLVIREVGFKKRAKITNEVQKGFLLSFDEPAKVGKFKVRVEKCTKS